MRKVFLYGLYFLATLSILNAGASAEPDTNSTIWVSGKLQAVYSSAPQTSKAENRVQYYLSIDKIKMVRLDMSRIVSMTWLGLVGKNVEIQISQKNQEEVKARRQRSYMVLDIRYKISALQSKGMEKALQTPDNKKPWLNLLCKFADIDTEPHERNFYQTIFGDSYPYLEHYWKETTYGHIDISGTQTIDWVTLPHDHDYYKPDGEETADTTLLREDCIVSAGGADILDAYYGVNLFFNGVLSDRWSGYGGGGTTWINLGAESNLYLIAHEMGHGYGLPHSSGRYGSNYDSPWDVMSGGEDGQQHGDYFYAPSHTIAYDKQKLGAININTEWNNAEIDASEGVLIHLANLEENATMGDYLIANIYSVDGTKHYTIEARDQIGYDSSLPAKAVIIHEIEPGPFGFRPYVVDPDNNGDVSDAGAQWQAGETFSDENHSISVEIVQNTDTGYDIRITAAQVRPSTVADITATRNLLEKVRISWAPVQGAEYYKVLRYNQWDINSTHATYTTADNSTWYDDQPDDAVFRYYRVEACNSVGCSQPTQYAYAIGARPKIKNLTASQDRLNHVSLSWDSLEGASYYKIIRYDDSALTENKQEYTSNNNSYDDVIHSSSYYYYIVQGCSSSGCSIRSYSTFGREAVVENIEASDTLISKIHISWDAVKGAIYYKVLRYDGWASLSSPHETFTTDNNSTSYDDIPDDDSYYYYRVQACDDEGCSLVNQWIYGGGSRASVSNIHASSDLLHRVHLSWDALSGASYYKIIRYDDYEQTVNRQVFTTNEASYDDNLQENDTYVGYYYSVQACDDEGCSLDSYSTHGKQALVSSIDATDSLISKITVSWSAITTATYYKVTRYDGYDMDSTHETFTTDNNSTSYDDVPDDNSYYYYRVQACDDVGCSPLSPSEYASGKRASVRDIQATEDQIGKITVSWSAITTATYYKVTRYDGYDMDSTHETFTTDNNSTSYDDIPDDDSYYYYRVQACDDEGCTSVEQYYYGYGKQILPPKTYTTTSFYIAYDSNDRTQYALVMPSVQKIYTHQAGDIQHLTQVDTDFNSFPSYDKGQLCFSTLKSSASTTQAPTMANKCYEVKFFYTQKEKTDNGTAFMLYYKPADKLYEGLAGDASSFQVVKDADEIHNENSVTQEDYSHFRFDTVGAAVEIGRVK